MKLKFETISLMLLVIALCAGLYGLHQVITEDREPCDQTTNSFFNGDTDLPFIPVNTATVSKP